MLLFYGGTAKSAAKSGSAVKTVTTLQAQFRLL